MSSNCAKEPLRQKGRFGRSSAPSSAPYLAESAAAKRLYRVKQTGVQEQEQAEHPTYQASAVVEVVAQTEHQTYQASVALVVVVEAPAERE